MPRRSNTKADPFNARSSPYRVAAGLCIGHGLWAGSVFAQSEPTEDFIQPKTGVETQPSTSDEPRVTSEQRPPVESASNVAAGEAPEPNDATTESKPETRPLPPSKSVSAKPSAATSGAEPKRMFGTFEGTYGSSGLVSGFSFGPTGGFYIGGELSVVRQFQEFAWLGGYIDGVYDFGKDQTRLSIGPEFGWSALGVDGGYLLAVDTAGVHHGVTARPLLTMGFVSAYGRISHLFGVNSTWLEAGVLLKYPVEF